ncbi:MAG TPA: site-2 protease family protein [Acidimicrobiales bacterium]|nr:site-2 protease family protein [Acidimicrobiales bacterium]
MSTTERSAGTNRPARAAESAAPPPGPPPLFPEKVKSPRQSAFELAVVVAAIVALTVLTGTTDIAIILACIVVIVMVHEFGHFLAAKHGGMKVTEYFLGFGPRLWSFRRGETEYGIKAFPLGGYVRIPGMTNLEEVDPADESRTYRQQPFHARLLVALAGSFMHFVMAFILLWSVLTFVGVPSSSQIEVQVAPSIAGKTSPAAEAGLKSGDIVVSINGKAVNGNPDTLTHVIQSHPGHAVPVVVDRGGHRVSLTVTPANGRTVNEKGAQAPKGSAPYGVIGVTLEAPTVRSNPIHAIGTTAADIGHFTWSTVTLVGGLFSPSSISSRFHQVASAQAANQAAANGTRVSSIVGAVGIGGQAVKAGIGDTLIFLVSINLFLGVFNLFPMLPLDGGHVVIAVYEKIRTGSRKVLYHADVAKLMPFTWLMLAFLGVLFATALLSDLLHPIANPFN